ncbi:PEP-CTERM sorting domain-containing protein [Sphaerotilus sp.]|uniref:PEP-CTERM sorting domain-containing protein n=1 Tax=Sphaerotilus sp. TaxID=2093942 RepID=UPI00286E67CB|nr:PEP-CTERM sorting domain-containing protein [Sphaerotilus sp.]
MLKHLIATAAALAMSTAAMAGTSSFDSGAEFASTQGASGWSYGYYATAGNASSFTQFASFDASGPTQWWEESATQAPWTLLWDTGGHPDGASNHWAVRRWTSGAAGDLNLGIQYKAEDTGTTLVHVIVDGTELFSSASAAALQTWSPATAAHVNVGSYVDFAIDANGPDNSDTTRFTAQGLVVSAVPEPESYAMLLAGMGLISAVARRKTRKA